jgi:hypothetical protein
MGVQDRNLTLMRRPEAARSAADVVCTEVHGNRQRGWARLAPRTSHLAARVHSHMAHAVMVNAGPIVSYREKQKGSGRGAEQTRQRTEKRVAGPSGASKRRDAACCQRQARKHQQGQRAAERVHSLTPLLRTHTAVTLPSPASSMRDVHRATPSAHLATVRSWTTGAPWIPAPR